MAESLIFIKVRYDTAAGGDNVSAGEASAGDVTVFTRTLRNNNRVRPSQVYLWFDPSIEFYEMSANNSDWSTPKSPPGVKPADALAFADVPVGGTVNVYLRRTIPAGTIFNVQKDVIFWGSCQTI